MRTRSSALPRKEVKRVRKQQPSEVEKPPRRRSLRLAGNKADDACLPNQDVVWKEDEKTPSAESGNSQLCSQSDSSSCDEYENKHQSTGTDQLVQPHYASYGKPHPRVSKELVSKEMDAGFGKSIHPHLHGERCSNSKEDFERSKNPRLNLPPSGEKKKWNDLDAILSDVLPRIFNKHWVRKTPSSKLSNQFDKFVFDFFKENCGLVEPPAAPPPNSGQAKHKGLESLRRRKRDCQKARKLLLRMGFDETSDAVMAQKMIWKTLLKEHNRLRRAVMYKRKARAKKFSQRQFNKDRAKYTKKLFSGQRKTGTPTFSQEEADSYFGKLYRDEERSDDYTPLEGMKRPPLPKHQFKIRPPTLSELRRGLKGKRNGAAPGLNGLSYLIYKMCPSILATLHKICVHVYKSRDIPEDWAAAYVVLLQKSEDLSRPDEFRPIAITNTIGKIFFSFISARLQRYMVKNKYINTSTQKGFLFGVPGCIEHSFALFEALRKCKTGKRALVLSWIDLANAYGSVRHNLIQFALNWYHVPDHVQGVIFDYYEKLCAKVTTKEWSTKFFSFDIGLFQGCVLSTILFDCVFNLLLDFLSPLEDKHGVVVEGSLKSFVKAYADDLCLSTTTPEGHQLVINKVDSWLNWTKTMRAKPKKCVSLAFRQFRKGAPPSRYVKVQKTDYSAYDPKISIAGKLMNFILRDPSSFKGTHFKFLGRWLSLELKEGDIKKLFLEKFAELMKITDDDPISGCSKLWIYQHFLLGMLSWPLLIQDFNHDFVSKHVTSPCGVFLKKWAGVFKSLDSGCLYRPKERFGLNLTSMTDHFEKLQVLKLHILKNSEDPHVRGLYEMRRKREASFLDTHRKRWCPTQLLEKVIGMTDFDLKFQHSASGDKRGLGHGLFTLHTVGSASHRQLCTSNVQLLANERREAHAQDLGMQGVWLQWDQGVFPFDLSWDNLIMGPGQRITSFVLNATHNSVMTPDLREICGYVVDSSCKLCSGEKKATLHHILAGCRFALKSGRLTWRHDSVLATLLQSIQPVLLRHNAKPPRVAKVPHILKSFVPAGSSPKLTKRARRTRSLLGSAADWKLLADFTSKPYLFPTHIYATSERPDFLLWSDSVRVVIFGELTCPAEEGIQRAKLYKESRYAPLAEAIQGLRRPWTVHVLTLEVGARGFAARSTYKFLRKIGFSPTAAKASCRQASEVAARCSYAILRRHSEDQWNSSRNLVFPHSCQEPSIEIDSGLRDKGLRLPSSPIS
jgi:hypothetical protein